MPVREVLCGQPRSQLQGSMAGGKAFILSLSFCPGRVPHSCCGTACCAAASCSVSHASPQLHPALAFWLLINPLPVFDADLRGLSSDPIFPRCVLSPWAIAMLTRLKQRAKSHLLRPRSRDCISSSVLPRCGCPGSLCGAVLAAEPGCRPADRLSAGLGIALPLCGLCLGPLFPCEVGI